MKPTNRALVCLVVIVAAVVQLRGDEVVTSGKRRETLDLASSLLAARANPAASLPNILVNPFSPKAPAVVKGAAVTKSTGTDREILEKIAPTIAPTGMMMFGGKPMLLLREKRLRVGDLVRIPYDGVEYVVVVTNIEANSFRLSLNREEITRPIKPGKSP
jgi:hypothetical protein